MDALNFQASVGSAAASAAVRGALASNIPEIRDEASRTTREARVLPNSAFTPPSFCDYCNSKMHILPNEPKSGRYGYGDIKL
jgi:hypothetical protein